MLELKDIEKRLSAIPDPEIPVITIKELGVLREVTKVDNKLIIRITPTYSGCPAMDRFYSDIEDVVKELNIENYQIQMQYDPPWTTDWMTKKAKQKLKAFGIAPPEYKTSDKNAVLGAPSIVVCPKCSSTNTELVSPFGSTACKALYRCKSCLEPFDYFKCI
ncbi:MAG: phenylacetate-CoA oxygenase subunit PaaJ [Crocinitomicaceae bacterium]|nr:phenylacetate-CoA oxygenase subunit PaaJ [Crocinitomicaceae bacterium]